MNNCNAEVGDGVSMHTKKHSASKYAMKLVAIFWQIMK